MNNIDNYDKYWNTVTKGYVGFDDLFNDFFHNLHPKGTSDNYPHYSTIKNDKNNFIIEVAAAGFNKEDLSVTLTNNILTVKGSFSELQDRDANRYLHRGIARRSFTRSFRLSNNIEVTDAEYKDGILRINLYHWDEKEPDVEKIEIK